MELGSTEWRNFLLQCAQSAGINLDDSKIEKLALHAEEMVHWNRNINITNITAPSEIAVKHILDSIIPVRFLHGYSSLLDIGSGAGFPGIPIKILLPSLPVTLIDASRKKVSFLKHVIRKLELGDIEASHIRAEDLAKDADSKREGYAVVLSRAFSSIDAFIPLALPLLKKDAGMILAMKGELTENESEFIKDFLFKQENKKERFDCDVHYYTLPDIKSKRTLIMLKRIKN